jgi:hypothetical protein
MLATQGSGVPRTGSARDAIRRPVPGGEPDHDVTGLAGGSVGGDDEFEFVGVRWRVEEEREAFDFELVERGGEAVGAGDRLHRGRVAQRALQAITPDCNSTSCPDCKTAPARTPYLDTTRLTHDTGFAPTFDVTAAVADYVTWRADNPR